MSLEEALRDWNVPKSNKYAYILYRNAMRDTFREQNPTMTYTQLAMYTSLMYDEMPPDELKQWEELAEADPDYITIMSDDPDGDAATPKNDFGLTGDCVVCLEPLPPIWENDGHTGRMACCGNLICESCDNYKLDYMHKNRAGYHSMTRDQQEQHRNACWNCPFCRAFNPPTNDQKLKLLKKSRDGHGWADYCLYIIYKMKEVGGMLRPDLALKHLELAAERGYPTALYDLGDFYSGIWRCPDKTLFNIEPSLLDSRQYFLRAAEGGHAKARFHLAFSHLSRKNGGYCNEEEEDIDTVIELLEKAAEEGYYDSYHILGNFHFPEFFRGKEDYEVASLSYYRQHGGFFPHPEARDDIDAALSYYCKGAEFRDEYSLYRLGLICIYNEHIPNQAFSHSDDEVLKLVNKDPLTAAMVLFELGARQGHVLSQHKLAACLNEKSVAGHSVKLFAAAVSWQSAARYNSADKCNLQFCPSDAAEWLEQESTKNAGSMVCFNCFKNWSGDSGDSKFNGCSRCKAAWYCSKKCQVEHFKKKGHKNICGQYKITNWPRKDALEKTLNPFCVGLDPQQKNDQLSNYHLHSVVLNGTSAQEDRLDPSKAEDAASAMSLRREN